MQNSLQNSNLTERENVAEKRIAFGASSAFALRRALIHNKVTDEEPWGLCNRVWTCSERENHFVGDDLHNRQTGELYAGNGNLWGCGSKLCPSCVAKSSNRSRKELNLALKNQKLRTGENYQFITLTMPNPGLPLIQTREIIDRAWTLFRKRKYFIEKVRGESKNEEFTITENGYHYHIHLLCVTRFLSFKKFRQEWTECLQTAFKEFYFFLKICLFFHAVKIDNFVYLKLIFNEIISSELRFLVILKALASNNIPCVGFALNRSPRYKFNTADEMAMVKIKRLNSSVNGLKGAIQEVCKYVTKSDGWEKISENDLLDIARIERFPRMFELGGYFRTQRNANLVLEHPSAVVTYLIIQIANEILANLVKLIRNGEWKTAFEILEKLGYFIRHGKGNTILDTKEISDGENSTEPQELPDKVPKVERQANWRKYIAEFGLEDYLERLAEQVYKTREARKYFLKYKYEFASFRTMDGVTF
jgi:hypothetical protein